MEATTPLGRRCSLLVFAGNSEFPVARPDCIVLTGAQGSYFCSLPGLGVAWDLSLSPGTPGAWGSPCSCLAGYESHVTVVPTLAFCTLLLWGMGRFAFKSQGWPLLYCLPCTMSPVPEGWGCEQGQGNTVKGMDNLPDFGKYTPRHLQADTQLNQVSAARVPGGPEVACQTSALSRNS